MLPIFDANYFVYIHFNALCGKNVIILWSLESSSSFSYNFQPLILMDCFPHSTSLFSFYVYAFFIQF